MPALQSLSLLALRPLLEGAIHAVGLKAAETPLDGVVTFIRERVFDKSQKLPEVLRTSTDQAWRTLEIALGGETLLSRFDKADDKAFRAQLRLFLERLPTEQVPADFRTRALTDLRTARKAGLLAAGGFDALELAKQAGPLARFANPADLLAAEGNVLGGLGSEFRTAGFAALADLIALKRPDSPDQPLLVVAVRYFFRKAVETDKELFQGLTHAQLERLDHSQEEGFAALSSALADHGSKLDAGLSSLLEVAQATHENVLDLKAELGRQSQQMADLSAAVLAALQQQGLDRRPLRPDDSLALHSDEERRHIQALIRQYRNLPQSERQRLPALLNGIGKLEVVAGDFDAARHDFAAVAELVTDTTARAEAHYNLYRSALEEQQYPAALAAITLAATLDPVRYAPFPLTKFAPEQILGAGGFGVAFLCKNRHSGNRVVIKTLRAEGLDRSVNDVFREAQVLEELDHPAIIRVRDCDCADAAGQRPYLVMDYFEGSTLAGLIAERGPLSLGEWLAVAVPVAEGLQAAHARNILHRDVKPANVLVRPGQAAAAPVPPPPTGGFVPFAPLPPLGQPFLPLPPLGSSPAPAPAPVNATGWKVKLIDFGLALQQTASNQTQRSRRTIQGSSTEVAGTLDYAAPEQMGKLPGVAVGPASDVYGFAKLSLFALFGTTQPLRKHWRELPEAIADLLEACLAEQPRERPQSFTDVLARLRPTAAPVASPPVPPPPPPSGERRFWTATPAPVVSTASNLSVSARLTGHAGPVGALAFAPFGRQLLSGGEDKTIRLWDVSAGREMRCLTGHRGAITTLAWADDGVWALSASADQTVRRWDTTTGHEVQQYDRQTGGQTDNHSVAIAPEGTRAVCGAPFDGKLRIWELDSGREVKRLVGHGDRVIYAAFAPDGQRVLSVGHDRLARITDVSTARQVKQFSLGNQPVTCAASTGDGLLLLTGGHDQLAHLWDVRTGQELARLAGHSNTLRSVALSADGQRALTSSADGTVRLWEVNRGKELAQLPHPSGLALAVCFAADGTLAATADTDGVVRVWTLPG